MPEVIGWYRTTCVGSTVCCCGWVVLPVANFDAYFGGTSFSKKYLKAVPEAIILEDVVGLGVCRYKAVMGSKNVRVKDKKS